MKSEIFETFSAQNTRYGVRIMDNNNREDLENFFLIFYDCFGFRKHLDKTWYHWYYNANPTGVCNNYILIELDKNIFVGAYGFAKTEYVLNGEKISGGLGINGMIIKNYRKKGLYSKLMDIGLKKENYEKNLAFSFPHGANINSIKGHYNNNWSILNKTYFYFKNKASFSIINTDNVKEIDYLNDLTKINFDLFNIGKQFYFYKSKDWLSWRFINHPHKNYIIIGHYDSDDIINGYMVLGFYQAKNNIIRCQIIDYGIKNMDILKNLLIKAENVALENNADLLDLIISDHSDDLNVFLNSQFKKSEEFYELLIFPKHNLSNNLNINVLLGDFDVA